MRRFLLISIALLTGLFVSAQKPVENKQRFQEIRLQIENLLAYKAISPGQLKALMTDLYKVSLGSEVAFKSLKTKVDKRLVNTDIKLIQSLLYKQKFDSALLAIPKMKLQYPFSKKIERFEKSADKVTYHSLKKGLKNSRPKKLTFEPGITLSTQELGVTRQKDFSLQNLYPIFSLGLYKKLHVSNASGQSFKKHFLSQVGLKADFQASTLRLFPDTLYSATPSYLSLQVSMMARRYVSFDVGYTMYLNPISYPKGAATTTLACWLPINYFSLGAQARLNSNLKDAHFLQYGICFKAFLSCQRTFRKADKEEIYTTILRMKGI
jgi:hypothetical protein